MKQKIIPLLTAALGAVLAIGILTFAGPCMHDDGTVAACFAASRVVLGAGIVACLAGVIAAVMRSIQARITLSVVGVIAGIFAIAAPGGIMPLCMMQTMHCWSVMRPFAMVLGALVAIFAVVLLAQSLSARRSARKEARRRAR